MNELLGTLSDPSSGLQNKNLNPSKVIPVITTKNRNLQIIVQQCGDFSNYIQIKILKIKYWKIYNWNSSEYWLRFKVNIKIYKEVLWGLIKEMENKFNEKSIDGMAFANYFNSSQYFCEIFVVSVTASE